VGLIKNWSDYAIDDDDRRREIWSGSDFTEKHRVVAGKFKFEISVLKPLCQNIVLNYIYVEPGLNR
jgi:hypothetical protein